MKREILSLHSLIVPVLLSAAVFAPNAQANPPALAPAPVEKVFVPQGFDDNDNAEVILHGHFPDSCMKSGPVDVSVDLNNQVISLRPEVYVYSSRLCLNVEVPFIQRVPLGNLPDGQWKIKVESARAVQESIPLMVQKARSSAPDDYLYAPVDEVVILPEPGREASRVVVSGRWPVAPAGQCFELVRVASKLGADNSLVVLPIAELRPDGQCKNPLNLQRSFVGSSVLPGKVPADLLIHVRVLNGESLNKFYEEL